ncbi:hypothetical protein KBP46_00075 [Chryseobacterium sp. PCH239]|uniref:hypothetical protein n=1 Tax=Chryseobacterium sp. PCH239 TaxID=2825845 RepID=UPI001C1203D5|nr:hypothetical protein [Chryseobacterium sp. PCH239]QWT86322.1 hypothetical protein KBP46_00075 [Chryseobacterium sp. PCH239]
MYPIQEQDGSLELKSGNFTYNLSRIKLLSRNNPAECKYGRVYFRAWSRNVIIGVSSPEYIFSDKIQNLIKEGKIQNVGSEQKYDVEKIIAMKPDAIFTNHIAV